MIRFFVILIGLLLSGILNAQLSKSFSINFETNAYVLTAGHHQIIDSFIQTLPNIPEGYTIEIKGHTDNKGPLDQNTTLSKNRANSVLDYLKSKRFRSTDTTVKFYAYNDPVAPNTGDNLWKNRRVDINLYARKLDMVKVLDIKNFAPRRYKFNEDKGGTVTYDSTRIVIAPNSFVTQNGKEVTGEIDLAYMEYRTPSDFLLSGIPMSVQTGDQLSHFNSGGMFDIAAFQNGEQLILKKQNEKTVYVRLLLSNVVEQNFYQFDANTGRWNDNAPSITDTHGNMLSPFNGSGQGLDGSNNDRSKFCNCVPTGDTCSYIVSMVNKLRYYVTHEEPIRSDYPYKFVKNHVVDFKSPLYEVVIDREKNLIILVPKNSHNKLGVFTNYVWKYKPEDIEKISKQYDFTFKDGVSFVKISKSNGLKFNLTIKERTLKVTGEPADFKDGKVYKRPVLSFLYGGKDKALENKLKKLNRKNFKAYRAYTHELDLKENALENELKAMDAIYTGVKGNTYGADTLECLNLFYRLYLHTEDPTRRISLDYFNLRKEKLATMLNALPSPFSCKDASRLLATRDSIASVVSARRDSTLNATKATFAQFGINSMGIYNADQVKRINNPVEIFANYKTETNKPLKIISVYVSTKGLNGIINYNGYMGYGPYKFVYGEKDQNMLIAVDDDEKSYYCTPAEFAAFVQAKQNKMVSFILKPLLNIKSASDLQKIVSR